MEDYMPPEVREAFEILEAFQYPPICPPSRMASPRLQLNSGEVLPMYDDYARRFQARPPNGTRIIRSQPSSSSYGPVRSMPMPVQSSPGPSAYGGPSTQLALRGDDQQVSERASRVELLREELRLVQEIQSIRTETHPEGSGAAEAASASNAPNVAEPTPPPVAKVPPASTHDKDKAKGTEVQGKDKDNRKAAAAKAPPVLQATTKKKAAESLAPKAPKKSNQPPPLPPPKEDAGSYSYSPSYYYDESEQEKEAKKHDLKHRASKGGTSHNKVRGRGHSPQDARRHDRYDKKEIISKDKYD
jgi:hypothetical protein